MSENILSRIAINPKVMPGKPTIRGMRITVEQFLRALAGGISEEELITDNPELEKKDFQAVQRYHSKSKSNKLRQSRQQAY